MEEFFEELLENKEELNFNELADDIRNLVIGDRHLNYNEDEIGITSLLDCPKRVRLRKIHGYPSSDDLAIEEGFLFERVVEKALKKKFGDSLIKELELPYEINGVKLRGHLDFAINLPNKVIGLELKHTILERMPTVKRKPPKVIFVTPDDKRVKLNPKYIKQARIERFLLEKLFPDKEIEHYLFVKTTIQGAYGFYKSYIVCRIDESISEEELKELAEHFKTKDYPKDPSLCDYCHFKHINLCKGYPKQLVSKRGINITPEPELAELLKRREELISELEAIDNELKKRLKDRYVMFNGKLYGKIPYKGYTYNKFALAQEIRKRGYDPLDFFQISPARIRLVEDILGADIEKVREEVEKNKWVFGQEITQKGGKNE